MNTLDIITLCGVQLYRELDKSLFIGEQGEDYFDGHPRVKQVPKQLVIDRTINNVGEVGTVRLPRWLADSKGLLFLMER